MKDRRSVREVWTGPVVLGLVSLVGLLAGLSSAWLGDVLSWIGLATPVAVCVWALWIRP